MERARSECILAHVPSLVGYTGEAEPLGDDLASSPCSLAALQRCLWRLLQHDRVTEITSLAEEHVQQLVAPGVVVPRADCAASPPPLTALCARRLVRGQCAKSVAKRVPAAERTKVLPVLREAEAWLAYAKCRSLHASGNHDPVDTTNACGADTSGGSPTRDDAVGDAAAVRYVSNGALDLAQGRSHTGHALADIGPHIPLRPYYKEVAKVLWNWMCVGAFPFRLRSMPLLTPVVDAHGVCEAATPLVVQLLQQWEHLSAQQREQHVGHVLTQVGLVGVLHMLRMRRTAGSVLVFPPSYDTLYASFVEKHGNRPMYVGARALHKHCGRCEDQWWGNVSGSAAVINMCSLAPLHRILGRAAWANAHLLPHDETVYEVRNPEGYGARWYADGSSFRGFLEPPMVDGHEKGWKH